MAAKLRGEKPIPIASREFSVQGSQTAVWNLLNNPAELGKCVPGCEEVKMIGPTEWLWRVRMRVGIVSHEIKARAIMIQSEEPTKITLRLESEEGDFTAEFQIKLSGESATSTRIKFTADISAGGQFQWAVNQIIKSQLDKMVGDFASCISSRLQQ